MKIFNLLLDRGLVVALAVCLFAGCQPSETVQKAPSPVFFPQAPDKPRLQFLKSFSDSSDLENKISGFEKFVVGDSEVRDAIAKPYGVAMFDGKLYVCDVLKRMVVVLDLREGTFGYLTRERRMMNPVNIAIDSDGKKYIADSTALAVFVFDKNDNLTAILGKELGIKPVDVAIHQQKCYIADAANNQVVVLDKNTGKELIRMGREGDGEGQFKLITGLAVDQEGNVYVTDKIKAVITKFNAAGIYQQTIGFMDTSIHGFVRPKGIAIDRRGRIWVVDAASEVAKIYDPQGRLLLFFGLPDGQGSPGTMTLPADIVLDYDNVGLFQKDAVKGAKIKFLVIVSNQYGPNKINIYGFGSFPEQFPPAEPKQPAIPEQQPQRKEQSGSVSPLG